MRHEAQGGKAADLLTSSRVPSAQCLSRPYDTGPGVNRGPAGSSCRRYAEFCPPGSSRGSAPMGSRPFLSPPRCRDGHQRSTRRLPTGQVVTPRAGCGVCVTLHATGFDGADVSARPVRSYRTFSPLPVRAHPEMQRAIGGCFLLTFPRPRPAGGWALPTVVPCRARTFLRGAARGRAEAISCRHAALYARRPGRCAGILRRA